MIMLLLYHIFLLLASIVQLLWCIKVVKNIRLPSFWSCLYRMQISPVSLHSSPSPICTASAHFCWFSSSSLSSPVKCTLPSKGLWEGLHRRHTQNVGLLLWGNLRVNRISRWKPVKPLKRVETGEISRQQLLIVVRAKWSKFREDTILWRHEGKYFNILQDMNWPAFEKLPEARTWFCCLLLSVFFASCPINTSMLPGNQRGHSADWHFSWWLHWK